MGAFVEHAPGRGLTEQGDLLPVHAHGHIPIVIGLLERLRRELAGRGKHAIVLDGDGLKRPVRQRFREAQREPVGIALRQLAEEQFVSHAPRPDARVIAEGPDDLRPFPFEKPVSGWPELGVRHARFGLHQHPNFVCRVQILVMRHTGMVTHEVEPQAPHRAQVFQIKPFIGPQHAVEWLGRIIAVS